MRTQGYLLKVKTNPKQGKKYYGFSLCCMLMPNLEGYYDPEKINDDRSVLVEIVRKSDGAFLGNTVAIETEPGFLRIKIKRKDAIDEEEENLWYACRSALMAQDVKYHFESVNPELPIDMQFLV